MNTDMTLRWCELVIALIDFLTVVAIALPIVGLATCLVMLVRRRTTLKHSSPTAEPAKRKVSAHLAPPRSHIRQPATPFRQGGINTNSMVIPFAYRPPTRQA